MALDFPNNPSQGQSFTASNGVNYTWDGVAWRAAAGSTVAVPTTWDNVTGKPTTFPPSTHSQEMSTVIGLGDTLAGKRDMNAELESTLLRAPPATPAGYYLRSKADLSFELIPAAIAQTPYHSGTTPPPDPGVKPLWFDSNTGILMVWYDDGTSAQWVSSVAGAGGSGGGSPTPTPEPGTQLLQDRDAATITDRDGNNVEFR